MVDFIHTLCSTLKTKLEASDLGLEQVELSLRAYEPDDISSNLPCCYIIRGKETINLHTNKQFHTQTAVIFRFHFSKLTANEAGTFIEKLKLFEIANGFSVTNVAQRLGERDWFYTKNTSFIVYQMIIIYEKRYTTDPT